MNSNIEEPKKQSKAYTPKKGRPTPSLKQAKAQPGTFEARYSPAATLGETRKQRKELKASMSPQEWKDYKKAQKDARRERQRAAQRGMDSGDERYLLARDKGPERAFVRDFIDSRRYLNNFVMPFALGLLLIMVITSRFPTASTIVSTIAMVVMLGFLVEGIMLGRAASRAVRAKFPNTTESGTAIGFYAFGRATQPHRWRTPKPKVSIGDKVSA
ncbi:DUF3043 domain-containing protein [Corynebacterium felinum]|uniref:DUF3043 domain-containing protein n=1 Tax=Corynebacterium felinum TaxID=131318 RepID=A0ABU2BC12_9CORY|nr:MULTISPECIES: DUF3043 domain-containing protein [Corynebacterium]MDF5820396.1 DUF3043 domain-containing protein [Corynebacterium felinum]MDO4762437.1 DUF3043 domain-containing protein [Corynebacterium sp.]MDR7356177.1 hypothetical protein [Corynebacterium felinum]WJY95511.1 hypothetical protein CFELI_09540 [Corynebacterium felinum]